MSDSATDIASVVSKLTTNDQARDALGIMASMLREAYTQAETSISSGQGLQAQAISYLNEVNAYAQEIYAGIPNDRAALGAANAARLGLVASQTNDALANISEAVGVSDWHVASALKKAVREVSSDVGDIAATPFVGLTAALVAFLHSARTGLIIVGVAGAVYIFRKPILAALAKGAKV